MKTALQNRKGDNPSQIIVVFAIIVISIVIGIVLYTTFRDASNNSISSAPCASAAKAHSSAMQVTKELSSVADLPILCPTNVVNLKTTNEETAKKAIAKEMKNCWDQWGKGELQLFRQEQIYCQVCSVVRVDGVDKIEGFDKYLDTKMATKNQTYVEYLSGYKSGEVYKDDPFKKYSSSTMDAEQVAVIFYYAKGRTAIERMQKATVGNPAVMGTTGATIGGVVLGVGAAVVGAGAWPITVLVVGGMAVGGALGVYESYEKVPEASFASVVVVRPLTADNVKELGCQYSAAVNSVE